MLTVGFWLCVNLTHFKFILSTFSRGKLLYQRETGGGAKGFWGGGKSSIVLKTSLDSIAYIFIEIFWK